MKFQSDWLIPTIKFDEALSAICAIDLEIEPDGSNGWSGEVTFYSGNPSLDLFGDGDKSNLPSRKFQGTFKRADDAIVPQGPISLEEGKPTKGELYVTDGNSTLSPVRLVLDTEIPSNCRILFTDSGGGIQRVFPLLSEQLQCLSERTPASNPMSIALFSGPIVFDPKRKALSTLTITGSRDKIWFEDDRNRLYLNQNGDIWFSTAISFGPSSAGRRVASFHPSQFWTDRTRRADAVLIQVRRNPADERQTQSLDSVLRWVLIGEWLDNGSQDPKPKRSRTRNCAIQRDCLYLVLKQAFACLRTR